LDLAPFGIPFFLASWFCGLYAQVRLLGHFFEHAPNFIPAGSKSPTRQSQHYGDGA
jgi:hypothetical protein